MPAPDSVKRSKAHLALTMLLVGGVLIAGPYALASIGLMSQLKPNAWGVLTIAYVGMLFKAAIEIAP